MKHQRSDQKDGGMLTQAAPINSVDAENRTVDVVFSTADLCAHWVRHNDMWQRMPTRVVLSQDAMDDAFLKASGPVLNSHSTWSAESVIGAVTDVWLQDGQAMARLQFSKAEDVEPIWQRVKEGTLRNVSMGFDVQDQEISIEQGADGENIEVMLFTKWRPLEISMVAVPADKGSRTQSETSNSDATDIGSHAGQPAQLADAANQAPQTTAAAAASQTQNGVTEMSGNNQAAGAETPVVAGNTQAAVAPTPTNGGVVQAAPQIDAATIRQQEQERITAITQSGQTLGVEADVVQAAIAGGTSLQDFNTQAIQAFAAKGQEATRGLGGPRSHVGETSEEKFRQGAQVGLMARMGLQGGERNEFTGLTLSEMARQSLIIGNASIRPDRMQMIGQAFTQAGAHGTSDFGHILTSIANKSVLRGWEEAEESFHLWTSTGVLSDFKETKRVGLGLMDALPELEEGANYKYGTVADRGETVALATYGRMFKITRQAIINDDLDLFSKIPTRMGRAAKRTIGNLVYGILTSNPSMSDGTALFHANHSNLAGTAAALSKASLDARRKAMRLQKEKADGPALNLSPAFLIVPAALETDANSYMLDPIDPGDDKGHKKNAVAGMAQVVSDARLDAHSSTAWYLAANPNATDTIEVSYLNGVQEPFIEEKTGWSSDGVELKVRIDAGVGALDYRGLQKNAGV